MVGTDLDRAVALHGDSRSTGQGFRKVWDVFLVK